MRFQVPALFKAITGTRLPGILLEIFTLCLLITAAFLATLLVAGRRHRRSRERIPHLTLNLTLTRESAGLPDDNIVLTLEAANTGSAP